MRIYLFCLLLCVLLQGQAQRLAKTYYDDYWLLTTKTYAQYCRVGFIDTVFYQYYGDVSDYYVKTGKLQMTGNFTANRKNGIFRFYYPNGKLKTEGIYKDNIRVGIWTNYYENGRFKDRILFENDFINALTDFDSNGVQRMELGTGDWQTDYYLLYNHKYITIKGYYQDSLREGIWNIYSKDMILGNSGESRLEFSTKYHKGTFVTGMMFKEGISVEMKQPLEGLIPESIKFFNTETWERSEYASINEYPYLKFLPKIDSTVFPVDSFAVFPGGMDSLSIAIKKRIKLPKSYIYWDEKSSYTIPLFINEEGKVKITKEYNSDDIFYKQIIQTIKELPDWIPAKRNNMNVGNYFSVQVFLQDKKICVKASSKNDLTGFPDSLLVQ